MTGPRLPDSLPKKLAISRSQARTIREAMRHDSVKEAATAMGISNKTARNRLSIAYGRLGVTSLMGAANALGWFRVLDDDEIDAMCDELAARAREPDD